MNDEPVLCKQDETNAAERDPISETDPHEGPADLGNTDSAQSLAKGEDENGSFEDPALSASALQNSDPDPVAAVEEAAADGGVEQLRDELKRLREVLAERDAFFERIGRECEEFGSLYPDTALSSLPDRVWEDVKRGIPVAAAFALSERRRAVRNATAAKSNLENNERSSGALTPTEVEYFSPSEVRAMSQAEVRANYQKIMRSMQKWH